MNKWFESKNIANYAKSALLQAQKRIDQVLDIKEDEILGKTSNPSNLSPNDVGYSLGEDISPASTSSVSALLTSLNTRTPTPTPTSSLSNIEPKSPKDLDSESFFTTFLNQVSTGSASNSRSHSPAPTKGQSKNLEKSSSGSTLNKQHQQQQQSNSNQEQDKSISNDNNEEIKYDEFVNKDLVLNRPIDTVADSSNKSNASLSLLNGPSQQSDSTSSQTNNNNKQAGLISSSTIITNESPSNSLISGIDQRPTTPSVSVIENESNSELNETDIEDKSTTSKTLIDVKLNTCNNSSNRSTTPTNSNLSSSANTKSSFKSYRQTQNSQIDLEKIEKQNWVQNYVDSNGGNLSSFSQASTTTTTTTTTTVQLESLNQESSNQEFINESNEFNDKNKRTQQSNENEMSSSRNEDVIVSANSSPILVDSNRNSDQPEQNSSNDNKSNELEEINRIASNNTLTNVNNDANTNNNNNNSNTNETINEEFKMISSIEDTANYELNESNKIVNVSSGQIESPTSSIENGSIERKDSVNSTSNSNNPSTNNQTNNQSNSIIDIDFVKIDAGGSSLSGNASSTEEPETCASSDIEVLSLPSNSGDQLLAIQHHANSSLNKSNSLVQRVPSLASMASSIKSSLAADGTKSTNPNENNSSSSNKLISGSKKQNESSSSAVSFNNSTSNQQHSSKIHSQLITNSNVMQIYVKSPPPPLQPAQMINQSLSQQLQSENSNKSSNNLNINEHTNNSKESDNNNNASSSSASALSESNVLDASVKSILEARENHILKLNKQNVKLQEDNDNLINELEKLKYETNERFKSFQRAQSEQNAKYDQTNLEKDQLKRVCNDLQRELVEVKNQLKEKDEQIEQLTQEGLKLSKQELNHSNIIKKLRSKEKENEETINIYKNDVQKYQKELDELRKAIDLKEDSETRNIETYKKLEKGAIALEKELITTKSQLEDSQDKIKSLENTLQNAYKELAELHRSNAAKESQINEATSSIENQLKEEIQNAVEKERIISNKKQENLKWELQSVRADIIRLEQQYALREDMLRKEIADLQQQLRDSEMRNNELSQSISTATRPLLRQIENLQLSHSSQIELLENAERNLIERLKEAQAQVCELTEKNRTNQEALIDMGQQIRTFEIQITTLKSDKTKLNAEYQLTKANFETQENEKLDKEAQNQVLINSLNQQIEKLTKEKKYFETQLDIEKAKTETDSKKFQALLNEFTRERELQQQQLKQQQLQTKINNLNESSPSNPSTPVDSLISRPNSLTQLKSFNLSSPMTYDTSRNDFKQYDFLNPLLGNNSAFNILENLQSKLKLKEGEILQLQKEVKNLEKIRESMGKELVSLTNKLDNMQDQIKEYPQLQEKFQKLNTEYNALLQMYGEKSEECEELRLDLQDVKDMYKLQIEDLIKRTSLS